MQTTVSVRANEKNIVQHVAHGIKQANKEYGPGHRVVAMSVLPRKVTNEDREEMKKHSITLEPDLLVVMIMSRLPWYKRLFSKR